MQAIALRLRLLGHPTRLRLVRELRDTDASVLALAEGTGCEPAAAQSHLSALYRAGIVRRTDTRGPAVFGLVDFADWWLIDQFAARLSDSARHTQEAQR